MIVDANGRPLTPAAPAMPARLKAPEGPDSGPEAKPLESSPTQAIYTLPNGAKVDASYFRESRDRTAYPGPGGLLFIERLGDGCYVIIENAIVVDQADSRWEAVRRITDFHKSILQEERQKASALAERQERKEELRRKYESRRWPL